MDKRIIYWHAQENFVPPSVATAEALVLEARHAPGKNSTAPKVRVVSSKHLFRVANSFVSEYVLA